MEVTANLKPPADQIVAYIREHPGASTRDLQAECDRVAYSFFVADASKFEFVTYHGGGWYPKSTISTMRDMLLRYPGPWRVGSKGKQTIYDAEPIGDGGLPGRSLGRMDTPELAALVVEAVNAFGGQLMTDDRLYASPEVIEVMREILDYGGSEAYESAEGEASAYRSGIEKLIADLEQPHTIEADS